PGGDRDGPRRALRPARADGAAQCGGCQLRRLAAALLRRRRGAEHLPDASDSPEVCGRLFTALVEGGGLRFARDLSGDAARETCSRSAWVIARWSLIFRFRPAVQKFSLIPGRRGGCGT